MRDRRLVVPGSRTGWSLAAGGGGEPEPWPYGLFGCAGPSRDTSHPVSDERLSELIWEAAAVERDYEVFTIRVVLEHDLSEDQKAALWCLRFPLKELRYAMRNR